MFFESGTFPIWCDLFVVLASAVSVCINSLGARGNVPHVTHSVRAGAKRLAGTQRSYCNSSVARASPAIFLKNPSSLIYFHIGFSLSYILFKNLILLLTAISFSSVNVSMFFFLFGKPPCVRVKSDSLATLYLSPQSLLSHCIFHFISVQKKSPKV